MILSLFKAQRGCNWDLRSGASLGVDLFHPVELRTQLTNALIPRPGVRGELIELGVKRQDQRRRWFENAAGIFVHQLFEKHRCARPIRIGASQHVRQTETEQCLFTFIRRGRKAQTLLIIANGVIVGTRGKGAIRTFEQTRSRRRGSWPRSWC